MMREHVSAEALEAYVIGALDGAELISVEAHVMACKTCEARLQNEARLDMVFTALAHETRPRKTYTASVVSLGAFAGTALAMAAAMILWVLPHGETEHPQSSEPPVLTDTNGGDASTVTASLELQVDGSRVGVRD
jgi:anti-sigma factor ChrR (cupin superfamily)